MPILINTPERERAAAYLREAYPAGVAMATLRATLARDFGFRWSEATVYTWAHHLGLKRPARVVTKWPAEVDQLLRAWAREGVKVDSQTDRLNALGTHHYVSSEVSERRKALGLATKTLVGWKARPQALDLVLERHGLDSARTLARRASVLVGVPVSSKAIRDVVSKRGIRAGENHGDLRIADAARHIGVTAKQLDAVIRRLGIKPHGRNRRVRFLRPVDVASLAAYLADIVGGPTPGGRWEGKEVRTRAGLRVHRSPWWTMLLPVRRGDRATLERGAFVGRVVRQVGNALDIETTYGRVRLAAELVVEDVPEAPLVQPQRWA